MKALDIIKIRKNLKLTQDEFGKLLGVDKRTIINYEQGSTIPVSKVKLIELMISNGLLDPVEDNSKSKPTVKIEEPVDNEQNLLSEIEILKDHIKTLKDLIDEKNKLAEMYRNENNLLREKLESKGE
jgi:DNA-binding XRE family transcriptional regulator